MIVLITLTKQVLTSESKSLDISVVNIKAVFYISFSAGYTSRWWRVTWVMYSTLIYSGTCTVLYERVIESFTLLILSKSLIHSVVNMNELFESFSLANSLKNTDSFRVEATIWCTLLSRFWGFLELFLLCNCNYLIQNVSLTEY